MLKVTLEDDVTGVTIEVAADLLGSVSEDPMWASVRIKDALGLVDSMALCRDVDDLLLILRDQYEMFK